VIATATGGVLSDRLGRRRMFVLIASMLQAVAALSLALAPNLAVTMAASAVFGAGYGCYMSVDQALVTAVLPDARSRAKDLGIMNVAAVVPQALAPLLASVLITSLGGYRTLYLVTATTAAIGGGLVLLVRAVR
jgi:MFS family permease